MKIRPLKLLLLVTAIGVAVSFTYQPIIVEEPVSPCPGVSYNGSEPYPTQGANEGPVRSLETVISFQLPAGKLHGVLWPPDGESYIEAWGVYAGQEHFIRLAIPKSFVVDHPTKSDSWDYDLKPAGANFLHCRLMNQKQGVIHHITLPTRQAGYWVNPLRNRSGEEFVVIFSPNERNPEQAVVAIAWL